MKNWTANILTLQKYDIQLRDLETKYRTIPGERVKLREEYEAAKAQLAAARENAAKADQNVKQAEADIAALNIFNTTGGKNMYCRKTFEELLDVGFPMRSL